jgi:hypothetical protein
VLSLAASVLALSACSQSFGDAWWATTPVAPSPASSTPAALTIINLVFEPRMLTGGATSVGTLSLDRVAGGGGTEVRLSSSDPAVTVPTAVLVPPGARSVTFPVGTRAVSRDVNVEVVGAADGVTGRAAIDVFAILPTSLTWESDLEDPVFRGRSDRLTPENATFVARCERDTVMVQIDGPGNRDASFRFEPAQGGRLRPGSYDGAMRFATPTIPALDVAVNGTGCNASSGRFVVSQADFASNGAVRRFVATFEHFCVGRRPLKGELRLTGPFPLPPFVVTCSSSTP